MVVRRFCVNFRICSFLICLHREQRYTLQSLHLHAERAASSGERLPVVGDKRLRAGNIPRRQIDGDLLRAAVDERDGAGVFGFLAERVPSVFVGTDHAEHVGAGRDIRTFAGSQNEVIGPHRGHGPGRHVEPGHRRP